MAVHDNLVYEIEDAQAGFRRYNTINFQTVNDDDLLYAFRTEEGSDNYTVWCSPQGHPERYSFYNIGSAGSIDPPSFPPVTDISSYRSVDEWYLLGYNHPVQSGTGTFETISAQFPLFENQEDARHYVLTGDDREAINYDDLHGSTVDFYLTNNGSRISVKYDLPPGVSAGEVPVIKIDSFTLTFHSDIPAVTKDITINNITAETYNTSWDDVVSAMITLVGGWLVSEAVKTLEVTITVNYKSNKVANLKAKITRKIGGIVGDITAIPIIGEDNGYRLYCATDNRFDDISTPSDDSSDATGGGNDGTGFGGFSSFLATYSISKQALSDLGNFVWNNSLFDNVKLLNNSPLENIVACHYMPCEIGGTSQKIVLGNITTEVTGEMLTQNLTKVEIANFYMPVYASDFTAYEPYTSVAIYLPLVGMVDFQPKDICGHNVSIEYAYDVVCGSFGVFVYTSKGGGKTLLYSSCGVCSVNIPLTASNQAQVQTSILESGISLVGNAIGANAMGIVNDVANIATVQNHSNTFGSPSSMVGALSPNYCYYIVRYPIIDLPANFAHTKGYICMDTYKLSSLKGFTKLSNDVDLSGFNLTANEINRLHSILTSGFYL